MKTPKTHEIYSAAMERKYWKSFYIGVFLFGVGEITPRTTFELGFASFVMLFSAMVNANIFGTMAVLVQELSSKQMRFQQQLDTVNTAMKNLNLPTKLRREVNEFFLNTQSTQD